MTLKDKKKNDNDNALLLKKKCACLKELDYALFSKICVFIMLLSEQGDGS